MNRRSALRFAGLGALTMAPLIAGCPGVDLAALDEYLDQEVLIGGNQQRAVLQRVDVPVQEFASAGLFWSLDLESTPDSLESLLDRFAPTISFAVLDLASGQVSPLDLVVDLYTTVVSDGNRLAWVDRDAGAVRVLDLVTGATDTYLAGQVDDSMEVQTLAGDLLLVPNYTESSASLLVVNLAAGEVLTLNAAASEALYAVTDGEWIAVQYDSYPPADVAYGSADDWMTATTTTRVELIDPATGDRTTIVPTTEGVISVLGIAVGRVVWSKYTYPDWTEESPQIPITVQAYAIAAGQTETVLDIDAAADFNDLTYPVAVGEAGVLLLRMVYYTNALETIYQLRTWDGQTQQIVDHTSAISAYPDVQMVGLAGGFVLYEDLDNGGWVIYDPVTQTHRAVQPF